MMEAISYLCIIFSYLVKILNLQVISAYSSAIQPFIAEKYPRNRTEPDEVPHNPRTTVW
jgi:hypothetical protein